MHLFGTDGIRGPVGKPPLTAACFEHIARQVATALDESEYEYKRSAIIGHDTRASGQELTAALAFGLTSCGWAVDNIGCLPTPAVATLVRQRGAGIGLMVTASHNPHTDNGIKFFGPDGDKISDALEADISKAYFKSQESPPPSSQGYKMPTELAEAQSLYIQWIHQSLGKLSLHGRKIVLDCAHGAACIVGPALLRSFGAELYEIGTSPNGENINTGCGATNLEAARAAVLDKNAEFAIAFDGDADRVLMIDGKGRTLNGDHIIAVLARDLAARQSLPSMTAVATVMSNIGLERYLERYGIDLIRTSVGDRHVIAAMREQGFAVGGEQSGHIILADHALTGDGIAAACHTLCAAERLGLHVDEIYDEFQELPQKLCNLRLTNNMDAKAFMKREDVQKAVDFTQKNLAGLGRVLVRPSGTEPLLRVMIEAETMPIVEAEMKDLCKTLQPLLETLP